MGMEVQNFHQLLRKVFEGKPTEKKQTLIALRPFLDAMKDPEFATKEEGYFAEEHWPPQWVQTATNLIGFLAKWFCGEIELAKAAHPKSGIISLLDYTQYEAHEVAFLAVWGIFSVCIDVKELWYVIYSKSFTQAIAIISGRITDFRHLELLLAVTASLAYKFSLNDSHLDFLLPLVFQATQARVDDPCYRLGLLAIFDLARAYPSNAQRIVESGIVPWIVSALETSSLNPAMRALVVLATHSDISALILSLPNPLPILMKALIDTSASRRDAAFLVRYLSAFPEGAQAIIGHSALHYTLRQCLTNEENDSILMESAFVVSNLISLSSTEQKTKLVAGGLVEDLLRVIEDGVQKYPGSEEKQIAIKVAVDGCLSLLQHAQYTVQVLEAGHWELLEAVKGKKIVERLLGFEMGPEVYTTLKPLLDAANDFQFDGVSPSTFYEDKEEIPLQPKNLNLAPPIPAKSVQHNAVPAVFLCED
eukprot:TRINITY_DN5075_c0_g1_i1.p1 TRINITY_DN5075_c0_g1~~TRINITY_DN5075_c0_g1_i1.p1  ORF type:complete len:509 (-),score=115.31 TRINITY_DN5075_c0_g1_i1:76-1506(-)